MRELESQIKANELSKREYNAQNSLVSSDIADYFDSDEMLLTRLTDAEEQLQYTREIVAEFNDNTVR